MSNLNLLIPLVPIVLALGFLAWGACDLIELADDLCEYGCALRPYDWGG